jgi:hypothetical protein
MLDGKHGPFLMSEIDKLVAAILTHAVSQRDLGSLGEILKTYKSALDALAQISEGKETALPEPEEIESSDRVDVTKISSEPLRKLVAKYANNAPKP